MINAASWLVAAQGFDVRAKYSSTPVYLAMSKYPCWRLLSVKRLTRQGFGPLMLRRAGFRLDVKTYSFYFDASAYRPEVDGVQLFKEAA